MSKETKDTIMKVQCHRCGWVGVLYKTNHSDGIYCPRCPEHKDDQASLSVVDAASRSGSYWTLLDNEDYIGAGDQVLSDDTETWIVIKEEHPFVGMQYGRCGMRPMRRRVINR